jgi:hypothetical protein
VLFLVVRVKPAKTGKVRTLPNFCVVLCVFCFVLYIFVLFYVLFVSVVLCIVCVYMCTELLPPGGYPIAVKYIISYQNFQVSSSFCPHSVAIGSTQPVAEISIQEFPCG